MANYEDKLSTDPIYPLILRMSLPVVVAQFVNMLYSLVDRMYIGRIPGSGTNALAGIGITNSVILLISAFAAIVAGGGAPLAAIALGKGDRNKAGKILGNGMTLLIVFSLVTTLITYIFMTPILKAIGTSSTIMPYAVSYLRIYLLGTLFVMIATGLNPFINAQGRPGIGMVSVLIGAVCNIILDPIFIFGLNMGVAGAAAATVISQFLSAAWVIHFLTGSKASLRLTRTNMKPHKETLSSVLSLGLSSFVMASTESLIGFVLNNRLSMFGDIYVSTLTVLQSALQIISVPASGFSQGFAPVLSYNFGHGDAGRVKQGFRAALSIMFSYMLVSVVLMILLRKYVALMFTSDPVLIEKVCEMMPIFLFGMSIFGLQRTCQQTFVSLGSAKISIFIALLRKVFLLIPLSIILSGIIGVRGVFLAEGIADCTAAILCTIIFSIKFPKILKAISQKKQF